MVFLFAVKQFCYNSKKHLLRFLDFTDQVKTITRSPEQKENSQSEDVSVEEDLEDRTLQDFPKCCGILDDMFDCNQKIVDPLFGGRL